MKCQQVYDYDFHVNITTSVFYGTGPSIASQKMLLYVSFIANEIYQEKVIWEGVGLLTEPGTTRRREMDLNDSRIKYQSSLLKINALSNLLICRNEGAKHRLEV